MLWQRGQIKLNAECWEARSSLCLSTAQRARPSGDGEAIYPTATVGQNSQSAKDQASALPVGGLNLRGHITVAIIHLVNLLEALKGLLFLIHGLTDRPEVVE